MHRLGFAFILARKNSKGLLRKNIKHLGGRPLIEWTLDYLCHSDKIDKICISTDDDFIIDKYSHNYNAKILVHKRPPNLCGDLTQTEEVLKEACSAMEKYIEKKHFGVYMQITEPFRPPNILDLCINKFESGKFDSVFAATEYHKNFWVDDCSDKIKRISNEADYSSPRQKKIPVIREDTGVCLVSDINIFAKGKRIGDRPSYILYKHPGNFIDIHSESDLKFAESLIRLGIVD